MHTACVECDCIIATMDIAEGEKLSCPQCGASIRSRHKNAFEKVIAAALAGTLFYIPANILPLMKLDIVGQTTSNTVLSGITHLMDQGYWWMTFLVFLCTMLVPFIQIILCSHIVFCYKTNRPHKYIPMMLKFEHHIKEWGMLEVYLLGVLVSFVKLIDMGGISFDIGFYCFIGLMVSTVMMTTNLDHWAIWRWWEENHWEANHHE